MMVKCKCGERIAVSISTEMIEETGRPKRVGREVCKCGAEIQVLVSLYFPTPYMTKIKEGII